ncbi:MAG: hypothetical protein M3Z05_11135 [Gemmatimonadota bacterium]|nr:hypothetical protein [Gemmatimonadota bacterium]
MTEPATRESSAESSRRRAIVKALLVFIVAPIIVGAMIVLVFATTPWGNERVRRLAVSQVNKRLTGELSIDKLRGNLFSGATLTNVQVLDSLKHPVFAARAVTVHYGFTAALRREVVIESLVLDTPVVVLDKRPGMRWNFQSLLKPSTTPKDTSQHKAPPQLSDITIHRGRFLYRRPWVPDSTLSGAARDSAIAKALDPTARKRTVRAPNGYQRVLDYREINAHLPVISIASGTKPTAVQIGALSMIAEPYRPPSIDVRSLVGTLLVNKDSLWWRGAHMRLPSSNVSGDGTIGFRHTGLLLDLTGAPIAFADLRWLDPKLTGEGGGKGRYRMHFVGDTAEFGIFDADLRYTDASLAGNASIARVTTGKKSELVVRDVDLTVSHLRTALIHELAPSLKLTRSGTLDGRVIVNGAPSAMHVDADVRFADVAAGLSHVIARGEVGMKGGMQARDLKVQLLPLQVATLSGAGLKIPLGGTLSGSATVSGAQHDGWSVAGDVTHVERNARSRAVGSGRYQVNGKRIVADVMLEPLSLVTVGKFAPAAQLRGSVTGKVHAEGTTKDLHVSGALHSQSGGRIDGRGTVAIAGARTRYDVAVALDALNTSAFSRKAPVTSLTGTVSARGVGTKPATASAVFNVDLAHARYDTFTVERMMARGAVAGGLLRLDTLSALERGIRAQARGTFGLTGDTRGRLTFSARVDSLQSLRAYLGASDSALVEVASGRQTARLAAARADSTRRADAVRIERLALGLPEGVAIEMDSLPRIRRDSLAGSLAAEGQLTGNVKELGVDASVRGSGLVVRGNSVRRLNGDVSSPNLRDGSKPLKFRLDADSVEASGLAFEQVHADGTRQNGRVLAALRVRQDSLVSYAALGSYAQPTKGAHDVHLDSLRLTFDTLVWRLAHPGSVRLANGDIAVDSVDLRSSDGGRLFANGVVPKTGGIRLDVAAEAVRVSTVLRALQRDMNADGLVSASAQLTGTRANPTIVGRTTLRDANYQGTRSPDADVDVQYAERALALNAIAHDSTGKRVLAGSALLPYDLALTSVTGSRKLPGALTADVAFDSLSLAALPLGSRAVEDVRGLLVADVHVRGTWAAPVYSGRASLREGGVHVVSTGTRIQDGMADLRLAGDSLVLDSLVARARGPLRVSGFVNIADRAHPLVNMVATGHNVRVLDSTLGLLDVDADAVALGPLDALRVTGRAEMLGGYLALKSFRKDLLRVKAPGVLATFAVFDTAAVPGDSARVRAELARPRRVAVIADLSLVVDRGTYYRQRPDANTEFFTAEGEVVRAHIDQRTSDQWLAGFVRIGDGIAFFRTLAFVPARGALTFTPHTGAPGIVQQVGERYVWEAGRGLFPVQFLTGGTSKAPSVALVSGTLFPIRGRELNSYLTMGSLSTSLLQQSGSSLSGSEAWSGQLSGETGALAHRQQGATALGVVLHDIGTGATKEFGLDAFSVSPADVPTELVLGKTGGVRGALIEAGRYVTTDRYIGAELRFTTGIPGLRMAQRFGTLYRLDVGVEPWFMLRPPSELGITHPTVRTGAFAAFLTRMWDF